MIRRILFFILFIGLVTFSCKPESEASTISDKEPKKTEKQTKTPPKKEIRTPKSVSKPSNTAGANKKIDHKNIDLNLMESVLHDEINKVRKANNLKPFIRHKILEKAAIDQNLYCVAREDLSHYQKTPGKETLKQRVQLYGGGFYLMAENLIYEGFTVRTINGVRKEIITPTYQEMAKTMVKNWLGSPGHRQNIMQKELHQVGTAVHYNPKNHAIYATQVFGRLM